jgi:hypothetical protein
MPRRFGVTIDCRDPFTLAAFWRDVLDYQDDPAPEGYASWTEYDSANAISADDAHAGAMIVDPTGVGPRLYFQKVPEAKSVKNRVHLDVIASDTRQWAEVQAAADRVVAAGGQMLAASDDPKDRFIVVADPEGNEFCLVL